MARPSLVNLETALWVARLGSYSAVAQKLHATQPAISLRIRELEVALGAPLFERRGHRMEPTLRGREFIERIEPLLVGIHDVLDTMGDPALVSGIVRIGSGDIPMTWMGHLLRHLQQLMPAVTFELRIGIAGKLLDDLEDGRVDLVVVAGRVDHLELASTPLGRTPMNWVMAPDRWARYGHGQEPASLADLLNCGPLWMIPRTSRYFAAQAQTLKARGAHMRNVSTCDNMSTLIQLVTEGGGVGFLPRVLIQEHLDAGRLVPLADDMPVHHVDYSMVYGPGYSQGIVRRIVELAVQHSAFSA